MDSPLMESLKKIAGLVTDDGRDLATEAESAVLELLDDPQYAHDPLQEKRHGERLRHVWAYEIDPRSPNARIPDANFDVWSQWLGPIFQGRKKSDDWRTDEALREFEESVKAQGLVQLPIVQPLPDVQGHVRYRLVVGFTRVAVWAKTQPWLPLEAIVMDPPLTDVEITAMQMTENTHRTPMSFLALARAIHQLAQQTGQTQTELGKLTGMPQSRVSSYLSIVELIDAHPELEPLVQKGPLGYKQTLQIHRILRAKSRLHPAMMSQVERRQLDDRVHDVMVQIVDLLKNHDHISEAEAKAIAEEAIRQLRQVPSGVDLSQELGLIIQTPQQNGASPANGPMKVMARLSGIDWHTMLPEERQSVKARLQELLASIPD